jgi:uncharacterized membrane protein
LEGVLMTKSSESRHLRCLAAIVSAAFALSASLTASGFAATFEGLGRLSGKNSSIAWALSDDGTTVVGGSGAGYEEEAFRWTSDHGIQGLGELSFPDFEEEYSRALGVSADGSVVVGLSGSPRGGSGLEAFAWHEDNGQLVAQGDLPGETVPLAAYSISRNGVLVGEANVDAAVPGRQAAKWSAGSPVEGLGVFPGHSGPGTRSIAEDVSGDASVIVGISDGQAFRWTAATGMQSIASGLSEGFSDAHAVSDDGNVVVGEVYFSDKLQAFHWSPTAGIVPLGHLPGLDVGSVAYGVAANGSFVVGTSYSDQDSAPFIWTAADGMRNLNSILVNEQGLGPAMQGWQLFEAVGISAEGSVIAGNGVNPAGQVEPWIARLDHRCDIPLPAVFTQYDSRWGGDFLGRSSSIRIRKSGCALTSLSMALNEADVTDLMPVTGLIVRNDPGSLNDLLKHRVGPFIGAGLVFPVATKEAGKAAGMPDVKFVSVRSTSRERLEQLVCHEGRVMIVGVNLNAKRKPGHYVVVNGMDGDDFTIVDPGHGKTRLIAGYGAGNFITRGYVTNPAPIAPFSDEVSLFSEDLGEINVAASAAADALGIRLIDPLGRATGFNGTAGGDLDEIPEAVYFVDQLEDDETGERAADDAHSFHVMAPEQGEYIVQLVGLGAEPTPFVLLVHNYRSDGQQGASMEISGVVQPGAVFEQRFFFSSVPEPANLRAAGLIVVACLTARRRGFARQAFSIGSHWSFSYRRDLPSAHTANVVSDRSSSVLMSRKAFDTTPPRMQITPLAYWLGLARTTALLPGNFALAVLSCSSRAGGFQRERRGHRERTGKELWGDFARRTGGVR